MQKRMQDSQVRVQRSQQGVRTIGEEIEVTLELLLVACMHMDKPSGLSLLIWRETYTSKVTWLHAQSL